MTANRKILLAFAGLHQLFDVRCKSLQCSVVNIIKSADSSLSKQQCIDIKVNSDE